MHPAKLVDWSLVEKPGSDFAAVYIEALSADMLITDPREVGEYRTALREVVEPLAMSVEESRDLLGLLAQNGQEV